jgi:hypothetical protein
MHVYVCVCLYGGVFDDDDKSETLLGTHIHRERERMNGITLDDLVCSMCMRLKFGEGNQKRERERAMIIERGHSTSRSRASFLNSMSCEE